MEFKGGGKQSVLQKGLETREEKEHTQGHRAITNSFTRINSADSPPQPGDM